MLVLAPSSQTRTLVHYKSTSPSKISWIFQGISDVTEGLRSNGTKVLNYRREVISITGEVGHLKDKKGRENVENHEYNKGWIQITIQVLAFQFLPCRCLNMSYVTKLTQQSMKTLFLQLMKVWDAEYST